MSMNIAELEAQWAQGYDDMRSVSEASMDEQTLFNLLIDTRRQQQQKISLKGKDHTKQILTMMETYKDAENQMIQEFENELPELKKIILNEQNSVIEEAKIMQIRQNILAEMPSVIDLETEYDKIQFEKGEEPELIGQKETEEQQRKAEQLLKKNMERMFEERELINMLREDERSMQKQIQLHKALFQERFFTPVINVVKSQTISISLPTIDVCETYTNLTPQMNNQDNTFSKHSSIIALQSLKKLGKVPVMKPVKSTLNPIIVAQSINPEQQYNLKPTEKLSPLAFSQDILKNFNSFASNINKLEKVSSTYKPKFLNDHLDEAQRGQNFSLSENEDKSLKDFLETIIDCERTKQLKVTFENLVDILYIETLPNLQYVSFKRNKLTSVQHLINNQYIIELNLSFNNIRDMEGIQYLKHLRNLNMEHNQIQIIIDLECQQLEILSLKSNGIRRISGLNKIVNLRNLDVSHNKLEDMRGLGSLIFLNNLNLSNNKIEQVKGIENCLLLKQLNLENNRINGVQFMSYVFLSKLSLGHNQLVKLPQMFLPSLEDLFLDYNRLIATNSNIFLPRLKVLNLDHNKLEHFSPIWSLLQSSNHCQIIKYDNNEGLSFLTSAINELYQAMIYKKMHKLEILNQSPYSIGTKRYYESQYDDLLSFTSKNNNVLFNQLSSKISLIIAENRFVQSVEGSKHQFRKQIDFVKNKSIKMVDDLKRICSFIQGSNIFVEFNPIFYKYDIHAIKKKAALEKIQTLVINYRYKKNKRIKYFKDKMPLIKQYITRIVKDAKIYSLFKTVHKFASISGQSRKHECANMIKSSWVTYRNYTRAMKLITNLRNNKKKIKKVEVQEEDFEEINLDFLDKQYNYATRIKIPEHMNFQHLIYKPQLFEKASEIVENPMIYEQSDTSSRVGSMSNTSSTNDNNMLLSQNNRNMNRKSKPKNTLPPMMDIERQVNQIIEGMRLENITSQIREQIRMSVLEKRRRQKKNSLEEKSWQKYPNKRF